MEDSVPSRATDQTEKVAAAKKFITDNITVLSKNTNAFYDHLIDLRTGISIWLEPSLKKAIAACREVILEGIFKSCDNSFGKAATDLALAEIDKENRSLIESNATKERLSETKQPEKV